jgi:hypothetical protein
VAAFIAAETGRGVKCSTVGRRIAGIRYSHKLAGLSSPTDDEFAGTRDRDLLLLGFALTARRSELVALDFADLEECPEGQTERHHH